MRIEGMAKTTFSRVRILLREKKNNSLTLYDFIFLKKDSMISCLEKNKF